MRLTLMIADAPHYEYFTRELARERDIDRIILLPAIRPPERMQAEHWSDAASQEWVVRNRLADGWAGFDSVAPVLRAERPNEPAVVAALTAAGCDVLLEIGSKKLNPEVLSVPTRAALNIHAGNAEAYRGVDSRQWTIFNHDFPNLMTTLHVMDGRLDTGPIVSQTAIPLSGTSVFPELTGRSMEGALDMCVAALHGLERTGRLTVRPQLQKGRYYSWMPALLKEEVVSIFDRHVATL